MVLILKLVHTRSCGVPLLFQAVPPFTGCLEGVSRNNYGLVDITRWLAALPSSMSLRYVSKYSM